MSIKTFALFMRKRHFCALVASQRAARATFLQKQFYAITPDVYRFLGEL